MTNEQITDLFNQALNQRGLVITVQGITRNQIYNWKNKRGKSPSIGTMLDVLHQLKMITIHESN